MVGAVVGASVGTIVVTVAETVTVLVRDSSHEATPHELVEGLSVASSWREGGPIYDRTE